MAEWRSNVGMQEVLDYVLNRMEKRGISYLPRRFIDRDTQATAWNNAFANPKRIKQIAAALRKIDLAKKMPKQVLRQIEDTYLLSVFFGDQEHRQMLSHPMSTMNIKFSTLDDEVDFFISRVMKRECPDNIELDADLLEIIQRDGLAQLAKHIDFIHRCLSESFYKSLSEAMMDTLDLALNLLICQPDAKDFAFALLGRYPWLATNQPEVSTGEEDDTEVEDDSEITPEQFREFIKFHVEKIYRIADVDRTWRLEDHTDYLEQIKILDGRFYDKSNAHLNELFAAEHAAYIEGFKTICEMANKYKVFDKLTVWIESNARLNAELTVPFIDSARYDHVNYLSMFLDKRKVLIKQNSKAMEDFTKPLTRLGNDVSKLTEMTVNQTGSLDEIIDLTALIKKEKEQCNALAPGFLDVLNGYLDTFAALTEYLKPDSEKVGLEKAPEVLALENRLHKAHLETEDIRKTAHSLEDKLNQTQRSLEQERDRRAHQESLANDLKRDLHEARKELERRTSEPSVVPAEAAPFLDPAHITALLKGEARLPPLVILETLESLYPDRLVVLDSARKSAREAENFELPERLSQLLDSLINPYLDSIRAGIPDTESKSLLPQSYAAKESDTVMKSPRLRAMREFKYQGEEMIFTQHLGIGRGYGTQHAIRVYFKIIDGKVVLAHCGEHMDNASTN